MRYCGHGRRAAGWLRERGADRGRRDASRVLNRPPGETEAKRLPHAPAITPVFLHLGIVLMLGLYIPPYLTRWFHEAARMLG